MLEPYNAQTAAGAREAVAEDWMTSSIVVPPLPLNSPMIIKDMWVNVHVEARHQHEHFTISHHTANGRLVFDRLCIGKIIDSSTRLAGHSIPFTSPLKEGVTEPIIPKKPRWHSCISPSFLGCCLSDPCGTGCPTEDLAPGYLSKIADVANKYDPQPPLPSDYSPSSGPSPSPSSSNSSSGGGAVSNNSHNSSNTSAVIGAAVGASLGVALLSLIGWLIYKRWRTRRDESATNAQASTTASTWTSPTQGASAGHHGDSPSQHGTSTRSEEGNGPKGNESGQRFEKSELDAVEASANRFEPSPAYPLSMKFEPYRVSHDGMGRPLTGVRPGTGVGGGTGGGFGIGTGVGAGAGNGVGAGVGTRPIEMHELDAQMAPRNASSTVPSMPSMQSNRMTGVSGVSEMSANMPPPLRLPR
ncbi:MAG: hypothetical protein Q9159_003183 [Coniocarpon cinnabarinum]